MGPLLQAISGAPESALSVLSGAHGIYTLGGLVGILLTAIGVLARAYAKVRDDRDEQLADINKSLLESIRGYTEASSMQKATNVQLAEALRSYGGRLEKLEDRIGDLLARLAQG